MKKTKPFGLPETDELFHKLGEPHYGESVRERQERMESAMLSLCCSLERRLIEALKGEKTNV